MNRQSWLACVAILATISAFFAPAVIGGRPLLFRDSAHFYYPLFEWCCREWSTGRVPLWNPYENCGSPVLADATSSVLYPGKLVLALPFTYDVCFNVYIVSHVLLAAASCYATARNWRSSPAAAALAAIGYSCGGPVLFQYCNVVFLVSAAWLPLALLCVDRMLRHGNWAAAIGFGAVLSLMVLGGDPQTAYHSFLATIIYAAVLGWRSNSHIASSRNLFWLTRLGLCLLSAVVGLCLSAAQVWPSIEATSRSDRAAFNRPRNIYEAADVAGRAQEDGQLSAETHSQAIARGLFGEPQTFTHHEAAYEFSVGPWRLAEFLWPNIGGRLFPMDHRWFSLLPAEGRVWTPTLYLGLLPAVLAVGSLCRSSSNRREAWLKWLFVFALIASLGYYGLGWLSRECAGLIGVESEVVNSIGNPVGGLYWLLATMLPAYVYFRYPAKWLSLAALAICLLGAKSFDRVFSRREPWFSAIFVFFTLASCGAAIAVWTFGDRLFAAATAADATLGPFDAAGARHDILFALLQSALVAILLALLAQIVVRQAKYRTQVKWIAVLVMAVDLWAANAWTIVTARPALLRSESPLVSRIKSERFSATDDTSPPRIFRGNLASWRPPSFRRTTSHDRIEELIQWERQTLLPKFPLLADISVVETHGTITSADHQALLYVAKQHGPRQTDRSLTPQPAALRLLATEFLILPENHEVEFATRVDQGKPIWPESAALWQMNRTLPRCWIVHDVETISELKRPLRTPAIEERTRAVLFPEAKPRDFARQAVIETDRPFPASIKSTASGQALNLVDEQCRVKHDSPQYVVVEADLQQPGLLVLADTYDPGWTATVKMDGNAHATPIYRTNRVLRGVWLEAGKQLIEFRYQPRSFFAGAMVSALSWLALIVFGLNRLIRRPKLAAR